MDRNRHSPEPHIAALRAAVAGKTRWSRDAEAAKAELVAAVALQDAARIASRDLDTETRNRAAVIILAGNP